MKKTLLFIGFVLSFLSCSKDKPSTYLFVQSPKYTQLSSSQKEHFLDSLEQVSQSLPNDSVTRHLLFDIASEYYYLNRFQKSFGESKKIFELSSRVKDSVAIAKSLYYLGDCYETTKKDSAYFYYQKAEKLYRLLGNKERIGKMLFNKAYLLFYEGNYLESEIMVSRALQFLKNSADKKLILTCYNLLASNFQKMEEFDDALKYYLKAKSILNEIQQKDNFELMISLNIAYIYAEKHEYSKAQKELESLLKKDVKTKFPNEYAIGICNLGYIKMKLRDFKESKRLMEESLAFSKQSGVEAYQVYPLNSLGEYFTEVGDTVQSIDYLKKSLKLAEKLKLSEKIKISLGLLSKIDSKNASIYDRRYIDLSDSLATVQRKNRNKYARIEFETSVVENQNKNLSQANLYLGVGIIGVALVFVFWFWSSKQKELNYLHQLQDAELELFELIRAHEINLEAVKELEQNRISRELHDDIMNRLYGIRLQLGILNANDSVPAKERRLFFIDELQVLEKDIRALSHDLHTEAFHPKFDYSALLNNSVHHANTIGSTRCSLECDLKKEWESISSLLKITIYRIIQEALFNMLKYANASECSVKIGLKNSSKLVLTIIDNGKGFDKTTSFEGVGLKNMKERANQVKAELLIESNLNQGTKIECTFSI